MSYETVLTELLKLTTDDTRDHNDENRSPFLESNRARTRELGQQLWELGGLQLMQKALSEVPRYDQLELTVAWDGVGDWQH